jgi:hypothetical protein
VFSNVDNNAIGYIVAPEKAGFQVADGELSNGLVMKAVRILSQKILRWLRINLKFWPALQRITLMASPWVPLS